eukprot:NODE_13808_length_1146_cov_2.394504.p1 GENE.NODE_13808_length_1146_cov_2.394504~~NODE_13808_length_1146_cov_2.394504.p1  ORF type:complete len:246 (+),score=19.36 NODE_13808_length_1146_cov_2.394504:341-1078(+)
MQHMLVPRRLLRAAAAPVPPRLRAGGNIAGNMPRAGKEVGAEENARLRQGCRQGGCALACQKNLRGKAGARMVRRRAAGSQRPTRRRGAWERRHRTMTILVEPICCDRTAVCWLRWHPMRAVHHRGHFLFISEASLLFINEASKPARPRTPESAAQSHAGCHVMHAAHARTHWRGTVTNSSRSCSVATQETPALSLPQWKFPSSDPMVMLQMSASLGEHPPRLRSERVQLLCPTSARACAVVALS